MRALKYKNLPTSSGAYEQDGGCEGRWAGVQSWVVFRELKILAASRMSERKGQVVRTLYDTQTAKILRKRARHLQRLMRFKYYIILKRESRFIISFYFIHFSRLNSISIILFWEDTGRASKNYQIFEISNHSR